MMKKIIIFSLLLWFMPHFVLAATVTEDILDDLGFYDKSWQGFLEKSETITWQCGKLGSNAVRYRANGDVIGYDEVNRVWWHLFTPISTIMPIEALALRMDRSGEVTSQIVTLRKSICKSQPKHNPLVEESVEEQVMTERPIVVKKPQVKIAPEKAVVEPVTKVIATERKSVSVVQQRHKRVQKNTDTLTVSSTWELMELYRQETGER